jgi:ADP-heptose:LPS heptosyltransferase
MKVDTMRYVDKWAGIPLTFLFTLLLWLVEKLLFIKRISPNLDRTLFIELSEMGSAVLADPAMRKLQKDGKAELYFAIFLDNYKSLQILKTVAEDLELFSRFTALLSGLSGARHRIGFGTFHDEGMYRGSIINYPVRYNPHVHISVNFMSLVNRALDLFHNPYATVPVIPAELKLAQTDPGDFNVDEVKRKLTQLYPDWESLRIVLINPNASDLLPQRRWLPEYFVQVGKELLEAMDDILIVATGAYAEHDYVQNIIDRIGHERCVNSAGKFEFLELIPLYYLSTVMLTNDSGPAHFSSVTPLKVLVIMGPETPALYGPLGNAETFFLGLPCSPCVSAANHRKTSCITRPCITGIEPEWVARRLIEYLK